MPTIAESIAANKERIAAGGETATGIGPANLALPAPPQLDLPIGLPQRGVFPADVVLVSDRSANSREFRSMGMRSSTFPYASPATPSTKTIISQITNTQTVSPVPAPTPAPSPTPPPTLLLETNGSINPDQQVLNLVQGAGMSISVDALGNTQISNALTALLLETDGTPNADQSVLNLVTGSGITLTPSGGNVTISTVGAGGAVIQQYNTATLTTDQAITANTLTAISDTLILITFPSSGGPWRVDLRYWMYWTTGATPTVDMYVKDSSGNKFAGGGLNGATSGANQQCTSGSDITDVTYANSAIISFQVYAEAQNNFTVRQVPEYGSGPNSTLRAIVFSSN